MLTNQTILEAARAYLRENSRKHGLPLDSQRVLDLMQDYQDACRLSCGPSPERCEYWEHKAARIRDELCRAIRYCQAAECCGR
jgi:hypothetical protein